jgi:hypothetical protein
VKNAANNSPVAPGSRPNRLWKKNVPTSAKNPAVVRSTQANA